MTMQWNGWATKTCGGRHRDWDWTAKNEWAISVIFSALNCNRKTMWRLKKQAQEKDRASEKDKKKIWKWTKEAIHAKNSEWNLKDWKDQRSERKDPSVKCKKQRKKCKKISINDRHTQQWIYVGEKSRECKNSANLLWKTTHAHAHTRAWMHEEEKEVTQIRAKKRS